MNSAGILSGLPVPSTVHLERNIIAEEYAHYITLLTRIDTTQDLAVSRLILSIAQDLGSKLEKQS